MNLFDVATRNKCLMVLKTGHLVKNNDCLPYYSMEKT